MHTLALGAMSMSGLRVLSPPFKCKLPEFLSTDSRRPLFDLGYLLLGPLRMPAHLVFDNSASESIRLSLEWIPKLPGSSDRHPDLPVPRPCAHIYIPPAAIAVSANNLTGI